MENYEEYLNKFKESKKLYEKAFSKEKIQKINRFKNSGDMKSLLNEITNIINTIKNYDIDYNNIRYKILTDSIEIRYDATMSSLLTFLDDILIDCDDIILNKIYQDGYRDIFLNIELKGEFNQLHINNGLPNFIQGIDLGKKIYKKLIKDYSYLSSFNGVKPTIDSSMVWESILKDKDIFSFTNDDNIICFWNEEDYDIIVNKLKVFYKLKGNIQIDDDFIKKYNINEEKFIKII